MEPLPLERLLAGLPQAPARLRPDGWFDAAYAIMTTDTLPKAASRGLMLDGRQVAVTGIAKGAGMIKPNMATMLGFVATNAAVKPALLQALVRDVADQSFNCVTVDGDTSTNDSFVLIASGASGMAPIASAADLRFAPLREALVAVARELAQAIVRDGEGATKFIEIRRGGARARARKRARPATRSRTRRS